MPQTPEEPIYIDPSTIGAESETPYLDLGDGQQWYVCDVIATPPFTLIAGYASYQGEQIIIPSPYERRVVRVTTFGGQVRYIPLNNLPPGTDLTPYPVTTVGWQEGIIDPNDPLQQALADPASLRGIYDISSSPITRGADPSYRVSKREQGGWFSSHD